MSSSLYFLNKLLDTKKKYFQDLNRIIIGYAYGHQFFDISQLFDMQTDINKIVEWCNTWSMELSTEKCQVMHLGKQSNHNEYFIAEKRTC